MKVSDWLVLLWIFSFFGWLGGYYLMGINAFVEVCLAIWVVGLLLVLGGGVIFWVGYGSEVVENVLNDKEG